MTGVIDGQGYQKELEVVPAGTIVAFHGAAVPEGWGLCDGTNGTPDLVDRFIVGDTAVGTGTAGGTQSVTGGLTHAGFGAAAHADHAVTQPSAHSAHAVTQPGNHSAHVATQPAAHGTHSSDGAHTHPAHTMAATGSTAIATNKLVGPATHSSDGGHTHAAHTAHTGFAVDAHTAHAGFAVDAHSAHSGAALDAHSAHAVTQADSHLLKHVLLAYIMKL